MKKEKKLNNRGFTLIEVLAVIVILVIIVAIAIPNISASLDRQSCKIIGNKAKLIESAAQFYVSDNRNVINDKLKNLPDENGYKSCKITIDQLNPSDALKTKYITNDDLKDGNNNPIEGYVIYKTDETYTFCFNSGKDDCVLNPEDSSGNDLCDESIPACK